MKKKEFIFILVSFFVWIFALLIIIFASNKVLPLQHNFLGGGLENYIKNPYFWAFGNYDGEHYTSIAKMGYGFGEQAFFPLYPLLIKYFAVFLGGTIFPYNLAGIIISLSTFFIGLLGFYKLLKIDFSERISKLSLIALLVFPTSFYFSSVYTESLFFMLTVWSFYFARQKRWLYSSIIAMFLTATRFVGIIIIPIIFVEWLTTVWKKNDWGKKIPWAIMITPAGISTYMFYLWKKVGDPIAFFNTLSSFGEQRSTHLIILPQVFYRYIFKVIPNLNTNFWPTIYTTYLEFFVGLILLIIICFTFRKLRFSYWLFMLFGYLIPTFSGSFSSLPRYVLILFPIYILSARLIDRNKVIGLAFYILSAILLSVSFGLFARGYWLS